MFNLFGNKKVRTKNDKPGFFRRLRISFNKRKEKLKNSYSKNKDLRLFFSDIFETLINGILINITFKFFFQTEINMLNIIALGGGLFILIKKVLPEVRLLLNSINLIKISR